ncbi:hypothetical protein [Sphingomonas aerolata]|uniref:hypothetical protein n=1 Tax=Sphingomonas aerolata TaxID=185951 RepID=UPI002FE425B4
MKNDDLIILIAELAEALSGVADEFNVRAAKAARTMPTANDLSDAALVERARLLLDERRIRRRFLPDELFHEPAWDMLLALFVARDERLPMNVKTLVRLSDAPTTTSQRWIEHLYQSKLINRVTDTVDRRRLDISLSQFGDQAMKAYLRALKLNCLDYYVGA